MPAKCLTQSSCGHDVVMTWALPTGQDKKDVGASTAWSRIPPRPSTPLSSPPRVTILSISVKIEQTYSTYLRVNEMEQIYLQVHWLIRGGKAAPGPKQGSQLQAFGDNSISRALTESPRHAESQVHTLCFVMYYVQFGNRHLSVYQSINTEVTAPGFRR